MATYGHHVAPQNDEFVSLAEKVRNVGVESGKNGPYLVDLFHYVRTNNHFGVADVVTRSETPLGFLARSLKEIRETGAK